MKRRLSALALGWAVAAWALGAGPIQGALVDGSHPAWGRILAAFVRDGGVDYAALKAARGDLDACLDGFAAAPEETFKQWSRNQQLAFLINLYNAATLKLIVDHYPVASIRKIGGVLSGPWKQEVVRLWGRVITLDALEHEIIRPRYKEPRVHFALVCAARSCPPLRSEAYTGERLDAQLDDQGRTFLRQPAKNRLEGGTLWLSPIFKWYEEDFTAAGRSVSDAAATYLPEEQAAVVRAGRCKVKFTDYDWSLNGK